MQHYSDVFSAGLSEAIDQSRTREANGESEPWMPDAGRLLLFPVDCNSQLNGLKFCSFCLKVMEVFEAHPANAIGM